MFHAENLSNISKSGYRKSLSTLIEDDVSETDGGNVVSESRGDVSMMSPISL